MNNPADTLAALAESVLAARSHLGARRPDERHDPEDAKQWDDLTAAAAALASLKGEAEPVAWGRWAEGLPKGSRLMRYDGKPLVDHEPSEYFNVALYTTPPAPQAVAVSDAAIEAAWKAGAPVEGDTGYTAFRRAVIAAINHMVATPSPQGGGELLRDALPYLREAAEPYEDDGGNEPLELARRIEAYLLGEGE